MTTGVVRSLGVVGRRGWDTVQSWHGRGPTGVLRAWGGWDGRGTPTGAWQGRGRGVAGAWVHTGAYRGVAGAWVRYRGVVGAWQGRSVAGALQARSLNCCLGALAYG